MSSDIAQTVQDYMLNVVNSNLSKWPAFKGTNAGGKTGTADYTLPDGSEATPHSWFISVAPMNDPQICLLYTSYITKVLVEKLGYSINATLKNEELIIQILWK